MNINGRSIDEFSRINLENEDKGSSLINDKACEVKLFEKNRQNYFSTSEVIKQYIIYNTID